MSKRATVEIGSKWVACGETAQVLELLDDGYVRMRELTGPLAGDEYDVKLSNLRKLWKSE